MSYLPTDYTDQTTPTGATTQLPATTSRGINAINGAINTNTKLRTGKLAPVRCATVGTETFAITSGSVTQISGTTVDGVSPAVGDRILISGAPASTGVGSSLSSQPGNGIYVVTANTTNLTLARADDMAPGGLATPAGYSVDVMAGTLYGNTTLRVTSPSSAAAFTWGTTAVQWGPAKVNATSGTLDGVTIGAATPATSVTTSLLKSTAAMTFGSTWAPWLSQNSTLTGTLNAGDGVQVNNIVLTDKIVGNSNFVTGLEVLDSVASPAVGPRLAVHGWVNVTGVGTNTWEQAGYVGVGGRAQTGINVGGAPGADVGQFWGGWFEVITTGGTNHYAVYGAEIDLSVASSSVQLKVGLRVANQSTDTTQGTTDDAAMQAISGLNATKWRNGILFGSNQANIYTPDPTGTSALWPFNSSSTIIGTSAPGNGLAANIGIDFSNVTFSDCAIKTGAAPIQMGAMASPPTAPASGKGKIYVASDGSLHYIGPSGTDTRIALA